MTNSTSEMVSRLLDEGGTVGMKEAGRIVGQQNGGGAVHPTTIARWCLRGVRLPDGHRVKLEHFRAGNRLLTTKAAILRFIVAQTEQPGESPTPRTPTERRRAADHAGQELEALGI